MSDSHFQPTNYLNSKQINFYQSGRSSYPEDPQAIVVDGWPGPSTSHGFVSRWTSVSSTKQALFTETRPHHYIIGIALRGTSATLSIDGRSIHDGRLQAGSIYAARPGQEIAAVLLQPFDFIRLHLERDFVESCLPSHYKGEVPSSVFRHSLFRDEGIETLTRSLMLIPLNSAVNSLYVKGLAIAILARLFAIQAGAQSEGADAKLLSAWRLKRATVFIDANIAETLSLDALLIST
jgi:hypothetical protein